MSIGVKIGKYIIKQSSSGFVIIDTDDSGIHLTVCANNYNNSFDIHVTHQISKEKVFRKEFKFNDIINSTEEIGNRLLSLMPDIIKGIKPVRIGWLKHRGYFIIKYDINELGAELIKDIPVSRKLYRIENYSIQQKLKQQLYNSVCTPDSLMNISNCNNTHIEAVKPLGKNRFKKMILCQGDNNKWIGVNTNCFRKFLQAFSIYELEKVVEELFDNIQQHFDLTDLSKNFKSIIDNKDKTST